ncbi:MAG: hypothetical protein ACLFVO_15555 [Chloroflexaceae bacterium]
MLTWREIWYYVRLLLRWWWLLGIAVTLPAGIAYMRAQNQTDYYVARTTMQVGDHFERTDFNPQAVRVSNDLASYYREMANREAILEQVSQNYAQGELSWNQIRRMLKININTNANLMEVSITDSRPERAALLADGVVQEIINFSPTLSETVRTDLEEQLQVARDRRDAFEQQVEDLQAQSVNLDSAYDRAILNEQIAALQEELAVAQNDYLQYLNILNSASSNRLKILEPATVPGSPMPSKHMVTIAMAGMGGLLVAVFGVLILDRIDDRWRNAREMKDRLGLTHLGTIPGSQPMLIAPPPLAARREHAMRQAYTRILLEMIERGDRTLLVTSPKPGKARSAFAVDLAELFARSGYRVMLVDADSFVDSDVATSYLSSLVSDEDDTVAEGYSMVLPESNVKKQTYVKPTPLENVMLLGRQIGPEAGPQMPMLPWAELLKGLHQCADVIIFEGPSALNGADAALLAPLVDGVVLTLDPVRDARSEVAESKFRLLRRSTTHLLGGVMVSHRGSGDLRNRGSRSRNGSSTRPTRRTSVEPRPDPAVQAVADVPQIAPVSADAMIEPAQSRTAANNPSAEQDGTAAVEHDTDPPRHDVAE